MDSTKKLLIALAVLLALVGWVYLQRQDEKKEETAYSYEARAAELPAVSVSEELTKEIDTIEIVQPAGDETKEGEEEGEPPTAEEQQPTKVVLKKKGEEEWVLEEPVSYKANASNVTSLLNNLKSLKVTEQVAPTSESYDKWGVSDDKGLHAVFKKGDEVVLDIFFGESGSRGQMARLPNKEGVFALKGYSKYLYARDTAGWRDKSIFKFDEKEAVKVTIENDNGVFTFAKEGEAWTGKLQEPKAAAAKDIEGFKPTKVDDLLRAYKSLSASAFGDDKKPEDVGLVEPKATVTIDMKGDASKHVLTVGDNAEGTNRWVKTNGKDTIFSISSWSADWATADRTKFQETKKDEDKEEEGEGDAPDAPPAVPGH